MCDTGHDPAQAVALASVPTLYLADNWETHKLNITHDLQEFELANQI